MTDLENLTQRLFKRIEWQRVPDDVTREDLSEYIAGGVRELYVMTGRALEFSEDMFIKNDWDIITEFVEDLPLDEQEYILVCAEIAFYSKVQTDVNGLTSYTTDAMAVSHGDKPFANLQQTIDDLNKKKTRLWYKMSRFHLL